MAAAHTIKVLFDAETIAKRNAALVEEIKARKLDKLLVVAVLEGIVRIRGRPSARNVPGPA